MRVKVIKRFKDKHNGTIYERDEILTISKKRFAEILSAGEFVEEIREESEEK